MSVQRWLSLMFPAALLISATALAQAADAPPPQQPTNNNLVVNESFADWTVRCFQVKSIAPCDMLQVATNKDNKQRVLLVSIAYVPSKDGYAMQMIVPLGVALAKGMSIDLPSKPLTGIGFNRCERDGCYVEIALPNDAVQAMSTGPKATTISLTPYGKTDPVKLPLSLNGFGDALTKLKAYAKEKASPPPQQP